MSKGIISKAVGALISLVFSSILITGAQVPSFSGTLTYFRNTTTAGTLEYVLRTSAQAKASPIGNTTQGNCTGISTNGTYGVTSSMGSSNLLVWRLANSQIVLQIPWPANWSRCFWSWDSDTILRVRNADLNQRPFLLDVTTGQVTQDNPPPYVPPNYPQFPGWIPNDEVLFSPSGNRVLYERCSQGQIQSNPNGSYCTTNTEGAIYDILSQQSLVVLESVDFLELRNDNWRGASWSPNSRYLAYIRKDSTFNLRVADTQGTPSYDTSFNTVTIDLQKGLSWSPDSFQFAFWIVGRLDEPQAGDDPRFTRQLILFDTRQSNPHRVVTTPYQVAEDSPGGMWSPDGQAFAFIDLTGNLVYVNANTLATSIIDTNVNQLVAWSPQTISFGMSGTGLRGQYAAGDPCTNTRRYFRLNPTINFSWPGSPDPMPAAFNAMPADNFYLYWRGTVEPLYSENYTFYATSDAQSQMLLRVNGVASSGGWMCGLGRSPVPGPNASLTVNLAAGVRYPVELYYRHTTGTAQALLEWQSARQARQIIPASQLYPPEGQMAFNGRTGSTGEIFVRNPDGSGEINVSNNAADDNSPAWSPDGTQLAFVSRRDGNEEIYLVNADGTGLRRLTNHTAADNQIAWSPDGTKIAFYSARSGGGDLYTMDVTGTGIPTPVKFSTFSASNEYQPMWSPNGKLMTYVVDISGFGPEIYMLAVATNGLNSSGSAIRLTTRNGNDLAPFFSPDGSRIIIRAPYGSGGTGDQIWSILTTAPYTISRLTSTSGFNNYFQSFSPDGSKIIFLSVRDGNAEIYSMNVDGSSQTRLTNNTVGEAYAVWSADARQITFQRGNDLWLMNADGSNQRNVSNTPNRTELEIVWWQVKQS